MLRVPYAELRDTLQRALLNLGLDEPRAKLCAELFTQTTCDGVYTHGVNRFPRFVRTIQNGTVRVDGVANCTHRFGALEQWNGNSGPGNLNAHRCMECAIDLAKEYGVGCVALSNTTHWMRGGTYGWQAADAGAIGICWTNTLPNLPPWGSSQPRLGNNPLVLAVPRQGGHIVLDMAMSQFSFGALESYRKQGEMLPVIGGFDSSGELTRDPVAIEASQRPLPIGYWKGSGLAMMLDLIAAIVSGGKITAQIPSDPEHEGGVSQVFIVLNIDAVGGVASATRLGDGAIASIRSGAGNFGSGQIGGSDVRYPGERVLQIRRDNLQHGVPVDDVIWKQLLAR
jgi:3-dehydro-L-gulonate 2-dehydrogenase